MRLSNREITYLAIKSRLFYTSLAFISHSFLPSFDKSSTYFLKSWDAFHFHNIAENGYTAEHQIAFFPLLPLLTRTLTIFLSTKLACYSINFVIFIANSLILYEIQLNFVGYDISKYGLYFFIFNPASIIMTAFYTESLFMLLFLLCIYNILYRKMVKSVLMISLSCLCRSNGILFLYFVLGKDIFKNVFYLFLVCLPISIYQLYCLSKIFSFEVLKLYLLKPEISNFQYRIKLGLYIPYSYIQRKYWNQGFMKFYTLYNLPNLLIGLPFISFTFYLLYYGFKLDCQNRFLLNKMCILLTFQTVLSIFLLHLNMYFRFVSYNPVIYILMGYIYKERKTYINRLYLRFYLAFGVAYAILYGAFYPPA